MDDYKKYVYDRQPSRYNEIDAGDLSSRFEIRKRLQCKSFKWFLDEVAPDLLKKYPTVVPHKAWGTLRNLKKNTHCVDDMSKKTKEGHPIGIYFCGKNDTYPQPNQHYQWQFDDQIEALRGDVCWTVKSGDQVTLSVCNNNKNQKWDYNSVSRKGTICCCFFNSFIQLITHCLSGSLFRRRRELLRSLTAFAWAGKMEPIY